MINLKSIFFTLLIIGLVSCGNSTQKKEPEVIVVETSVQPIEYKASKIDLSFKDEKREELFRQYIQLKTAFVNTNAQKASAEATKLKSILTALGSEESVINAVQTVVESDDIEVQRAEFVRITTEVEKLMQDALDSGTIYKQYCPMAFKNTGAFWLSETRTINNPYFGDKMLKCGRIDSEIK